MDSRNHVFMTIGAGPDVFGCSGMLTGDPNRTRDVEAKPDNFELLQYPPLLENELIQLLIDAERSYKNDLPYACFPDNNPGYYNSNGYAHGLLDAVGLPEPSFVYRHWLRYAGWQTPVPPGFFWPEQ